jgi:hypothetical protein
MAERLDFRSVFRSGTGGSRVMNKQPRDDAAHHASPERSEPVRAAAACQVKLPRRVIWSLVLLLIALIVAGSLPEERAAPAAARVPALAPESDNAGVTAPAPQNPPVRSASSNGVANHRNPSGHASNSGYPTSGYRPPATDAGK